MDGADPINKELQRKLEIIQMKRHENKLIEIWFESPIEESRFKAGDDASFIDGGFAANMKVVSVDHNHLVIEPRK